MREARCLEIGQDLYFARLGTLSRSIITQKVKQGQYPAILTQQARSMKDFFYKRDLTNLNIPAAFTPWPSVKEMLIKTCNHQELIVLSKNTTTLRTVHFFPQFVAREARENRAELEDPRHIRMFLAQDGGDEFRKAGGPVFNVSGGHLKAKKINDAFFKPTSC